MLHQACSHGALLHDCDGQPFPCKLNRAAPCCARCESQPVECLEDAQAAVQRLLKEQEARQGRR